MNIIPAILGVNTLCIACFSAGYTLGKDICKHKHKNNRHK